MQLEVPSNSLHLKIMEICRYHCSMGCKKRAGKFALRSMLVVIIGASEIETAWNVLQAEVRKRKGVSQYQQPHLLYKKGLDLMEQMFPGYKQELSDAGALDIDQIGDLYFVSYSCPSLQTCWPCLLTMSQCVAIRPCHHHALLLPCAVSCDLVVSHHTEMAFLASRRIVYILYSILLSVSAVLFTFTCMQQQA